jgi:hypothetical protein
LFAHLKRILRLKSTATAAAHRVRRTVPCESLERRDTGDAPGRPATRDSAYSGQAGAQSRKSCRCPRSWRVLWPNRSGPVAGRALSLRPPRQARVAPGCRPAEFSGPRSGSTTVIAVELPATRALRRGSSGERRVRPGITSSRRVAMPEWVIGAISLFGRYRQGSTLLGHSAFSPRMANPPLNRPSQRERGTDPAGRVRNALVGAGRDVRLLKRFRCVIVPATAGLWQMSVDIPLAVPSRAARTSWGWR